VKEGLLSGCMMHICVMMSNDMHVKPVLWT